MAKHSFAVYQIQVSRKWYPNQIMPVDDLDGLDLLDLFDDSLKKLEHTPRRDERRQYHLSVAHHQRTDAREVEMRFDYGKFGSKGTVKNVHDHEDKYHIEDDEAPTTFLRSLLVVPHRSPFALLLTESYGRYSAGTALLEHLKESTATALGQSNLLLKHEALADSEAFQRFLEKALLTKVEVRARSGGSDLFNQEESRPMGTFSYTFKPTKRQALSSLFRDQIFTRKVDMAKFFRLRTYDHIDETLVTLKDNVQEKTIILDDEETVPPLTYLLAEDEAPRPTDLQAFAIMRETSVSTCQHLTVDSS